MQSSKMSKNSPERTVRSQKSLSKNQGDFTTKKEKLSGVLSELISRSFSNTKIQETGDYHQEFVLRSIKSIEIFVKDYLKKQNFLFEDIIGNNDINQQIAKKMVSILQKAKNEKTNTTLDSWWNQDTQIKIQKYQIIISTLIKYIQTTTEKVQGEWDLAFASSHAMQVNLNQLFIQKQQAELNKNQKKKWFIEDYLGVSKQIDSCQSLNELDHRYIFQMKSNPFRFQEKEDKKIQKITNWANQNQETKQLVLQYQKLVSQKNNNIEQIKKLKQHGKFQQKYFIRLLDNNMLHIISQIIKQLIAVAIDHFHTKQNKIIPFHQYIKAEKNNQKFIKVQVTKLPRIIFYYIINSNISKQEFQNHFGFFKPLLKSFFCNFNAIFHVVGLTQSKQEKLNYEQQKIIDLNKLIKNVEEMQVKIHKLQCQNKQKDQLIKRLSAKVQNLNQNVMETQKQKQLQG